MQFELILVGLAEGLKVYIGQTDVGGFGILRHRGRRRGARLASGLASVAFLLLCLCVYARDTHGLDRVNDICFQRLVTLVPLSGERIR